MPEAGLKNSSFVTCGIVKTNLTLLEIIPLNFLEFKKKTKEGGFLDVKNGIRRTNGLTGVISSIYRSMKRRGKDKTSRNGLIMREG